MFFMKIFIKNLFIYEYNHIFAVPVMNKYIRDMAKLGEYYYDIRFNHFSVFVYTSVSEDGMSATGTEVATFRDREDARAYVWMKNGWGTPKSPLTRKY